MRSRQLLGMARIVGAVVLAVTAATLAIAGLESAVGVPNASSLYVVAVAAIAFRFGIPGAVLAAITSVGVYDFFFTNPEHTLTVADPGEWLNLVLLLFVAVTVGQLASLQRTRAEAALERERESRALYDVTRALATRETTITALPEIAAALARDAELRTVWIALGGDDARERVVAQTGPVPTQWPPRAYAVPHRPNEATDVAWTRIRSPRTMPAGGVPALNALRVRIEDGGVLLGSIWASLEPMRELPGASATRLLRVAADLVGQALGQDELEEERRRAEVARQSDALKSALLESVSHDLRTPLASIRAFAGTLMDRDVTLDPEQARSNAAAIDREAQRLNRLVGNLLDLGRVEGGALRTAPEALDLEDVVIRAVRQVEGTRGGLALATSIDPASAAQADPVLLEQALVNLLENAVRHGAGGQVRVSAGRALDGVVRLTVEDAGPGVPDELLPRIFDRFFRARGQRSGSGIGLAVVRGFVEAMGGRATARRSELGGLAVDLDLPAAAMPGTAEATE
jgi:two-component system sensor histidine kinase KdpD